MNTIHNFKENFVEEIVSHQSLVFLVVTFVALKQI